MNKTIHSKHNEILCKKLIEIRKKAGLTQRELAKRLKRAHTFVSKCELGERRTDLVEFYWICEACGVSPEEQSIELMRALARRK